jgi:hypoxanthine-DNA glycosylase
VAAASAGILVLGSMPGEASLAAGQYYAHPRNAFWPIMAELLGFDASLPYERRLAALRAGRIAVWDVLRSCHRHGSLDTKIRRETQVANDFAAFFASHRHVGRVLFNGAKAEECYRRHVLGRGIGDGLVYLRLPSTSPANASWTPARKLTAWRTGVLGDHGGAVSCA